MTNVFYENNEVRLEKDESLLDGLLRHGHEIAHGCKAGACQSCLVEVEAGEISQAAQKGLSSAQTALGYVLSCQCHPDNEIRIKGIDQQQTTTADVVSKAWLNDHVLSLKLHAPLDYRAGQYLTLWKDAAVARSYSIASYPEQDETIECHIKVLPGGQFSEWAAETLNVGSQLEVQGPMGQCFYTASSEQPLLLAAIGTGLAPIYGILKEALSKGHYGPIDLVVGAKQSSNFYLMEELATLEKQYSNLNVHWVAQIDDCSFSELEIADIYQFCKLLVPEMAGYKVYLCGADSFVKKLKKQCFLSGAGMSDIASDVFLAAS